MGKSFAAAALACGVLVLVTLTSRDAVAESEGFYFDVHGGGLYLQDADNDFEGFTIDTSYDLGYFIGLAIGYDLGQFRVEGEISSRMTEVDEGKINGFDFNVEGDVFAIAGMVNAFYDFDFGSPWRPYVGGGIGGAVVGFDDLEGRVGPVDFAFADNDDLVFAFQAAAGIGYHFNDNFALYGGYRFFGTTPPNISDEINNELETEFYSHTIELGLRYTF